MSELHVFKARRKYNRWVANQTLEDYALRFTAKSGRRWSAARVSNTALGAISFLALEAIGGAITLNYGFENTLIAVVAVSLIIFLTSLPISYYAARYGVDIDLLARGAGFGYIGSTITSLIYASFTFIFFALEAAIMSLALEMLFNIPLSIGYLLSSLIVIPLTTHGITFISRFQLWSQPLWLVLQITPFIFILYHEWSAIEDWTQFQGIAAPHEGTESNTGFNLLFFGAASAIIFSLIAQIGEQVDFLRFLPEKKTTNHRRWWFALIVAGPGWIIVGAIKILAGSFLVVLAINHGIPVEKADDPTQMYLVAFSFISQSPAVALALAGIFVIISQLKINVTNAYAGSIAWSNFFSRLTHSHPGRVIWLVFNVTIALLLMELGIYDALEHILGVYSNVAVAWVGALVGDLVINKPLGFSPKHIEFKRAHLYDINPVGTGAMLSASILGILAYTGFFGELAQALSTYISLFTAFLVAPIIAIATKGRYYIARQSTLPNPRKNTLNCTVCQNDFEVEDMSSCPAYGGAICSLCCSLDGRCHDQCKVGTSINEQLTHLVSVIFPKHFAAKIDTRVIQFVALLTIIASIIATIFFIVYQQVSLDSFTSRDLLASSLKQVFLLLLIVIGVLAWLFVLANESRQFALEESQRQTHLLTEEIIAHKQTDLALQQAKEVADAANRAKSRYVTGISHELRSPLNTILGYTQLLEKERNLPDSQLSKLSIIRRSGDHLSNLIEGMVDISRIEAGRLEIRRDKVLLQQMVDDLVEMFRMQANAKGIQFIYERTSQIPEVVISDEKRLRQILINLLSNAVKYTSTGSVTLTINYRNQVAEFIVSDTGVGIEPEDIDRIFQPFERIRKPGSPQLPGTGLGLTISKFLTEIMGGELLLESIHGEGSHFKLSLMLSSVLEQTQRTRDVKRIESYIGKTKTVMVVDDDATHRGLISEILSPMNFIVLEAADAYACLDTVKSAEIDLFLLDISMPGMNGWQLVNLLRERAISTPVIMVSANANEIPEYVDQKDNTQSLHDDYLIKPFLDNLLVDKVANVLNIEWIYEAEEAQDEVQQVISMDKCHFAGVKHSYCFELISMAEVGYIEGLTNVLANMEKNPQPSTFTAHLRSLISQRQFVEIITLCKRVLQG